MWSEAAIIVGYFAVALVAAYKVGQHFRHQREDMKIICGKCHRMFSRFPDFEEHQKTCGK